MAITSGILTVSICRKCSKNLTDTEIHFNGYECTTCNYQDMYKSLYGYFDLPVHNCKLKNS